MWIEWTSLGLVAITGHLHRKTSLSQRRFKGILAMSGGFRGGAGGVHGARPGFTSSYRLVQGVGRHVI